MSEDPKQLSVAELLARNGQGGSPGSSGGRRRRAGRGISVADLTGDQPAVTPGGSSHAAPEPEPEPAPPEPPSGGGFDLAAYGLTPYGQDPETSSPPARSAYGPPNSTAAPAYPPPGPASDLPSYSPVSGPIAYYNPLGAAPAAPEPGRRRRVRDEDEQPSFPMPETGSGRRRRRRADDDEPEETGAPQPSGIGIDTSESPRLSRAERRRAAEAAEAAQAEQESESARVEEALAAEAARAETARAAEEAVRAARENARGGARGIDPAPHAGRPTEVTRITPFAAGRRGEFGGGQPDSASEAGGAFGPRTDFGGENRNGPPPAERPFGTAGRLGAPDPGRKGFGSAPDAGRRGFGAPPEPGRNGANGFGGAPEPGRNGFGAPLPGPNGPDLGPAPGRNGAFNGPDLDARNGAGPYGPKPPAPDDEAPSTAAWSLRDEPESGSVPRTPPPPGGLPAWSARRRMPAPPAPPPEADAPPQSGWPPPQEQPLISGQTVAGDLLRKGESERRDFDDEYDDYDPEFENDRFETGEYDEYESGEYRPDYDVEYESGEFEAPGRGKRGKGKGRNPKAAVLAGLGGLTRSLKDKLPGRGTAAAPAATAASSRSRLSEQELNRREWMILGGQSAAAAVAGMLLFKGFERMWEMLPWVALALATIVILGLVALVRVLRRTDDILSTVIAVVVGTFVTLGPLAFLLSTG
ncbi:hypothetical protein [Nocardia harenae]|uniref:hypothetical protein n=1 Tax=Nocardia harenae TaxID=358707 RepID=UPI00083217DA|nr:hypothetical protein [Nocardia harenae]